jgi:hypothetical protein
MTHLVDPKLLDPRLLDPTLHRAFVSIQFAELVLATAVPKARAMRSCKSFVISTRMLCWDAQNAPSPLHRPTSTDAGGFQPLGRLLPNQGLFIISAYIR